MKNLLLVTILFLMFSMSGFAQNNIQFNINHKLGVEDFALETAAQNNLGHDFEVTRLQYYVSRIMITHDGGIETVMEDIYVLVDASELTQVDLGDHNINTIEKVIFRVGVGSHKNHNDPASYPSTHALAPKNPSMHWGWTSGYRFVAFEGKGGAAFNQTIELHGLGDDNYFITELPLMATANNNQIVLNIEADYTRALEDISVSGGLFVHGDDDEAKQCLENFRDYVFTGVSETTATVDFSEVTKFDVFPNPTINGKATIRLETSQNLGYNVSVTDVLGKEVLFFDAVNSNSTMDIELKEAGLYFVNLIKNGQPVITQKLFSK